MRRIARWASLASFALPPVLVAGMLSGCREQTSDDPPLAPERNMYDTERYNPESFSSFFLDHRTMRTPVPGTVARDRYEDDPEVASGLLADKSGYVMTVPQTFVQRMGGMEKLLARGQSAGIVIDEHVEVDGATVFAAACRMGWEGIV